MLLSVDGWDVPTAQERGYWRNIASLTMSARVKRFSSALLQALKEERHFAPVTGL